MLKAVLVMATITIIVCAAVIAIHELLARARHPQAGPPPRRRAFCNGGDAINRWHNEN